MKLLPITLLACGLTFALRAAEPSVFEKTCQERGEAAMDYAVAGDDPDWLFLRNEIEHLGTGAGWQTEANPSLPVIAKFQESLAAAGVKLLLVPVPAKGAIYPAELVSGATVDAVPPVAPFIELLKKTGAEVIDLEPSFRALRAKDTDGSSRVYCQTDSHWSPLGLAAAADLIAAGAAKFPGVAELAKAGAFKTGAAETLSIKGDLTDAAALEKTPKEELTLHLAGREEGGRIVPVEADPESPVILLGDSHTMVFTDGASLGMHCQGAGLRDQLQAKLGFPLAQISNQNSGADGARRVLSSRLRANPDFWKTRKLVIWVFSVREFSQGKWR